MMRFSPRLGILALAALLLAACTTEQQKSGFAPTGDEDAGTRGTERDVAVADAGQPDVTPTPDLGSPQDVGSDPDATLDVPDEVDEPDAASDAGDTSEEPDLEPLDPGWLGFIGSACEVSADCEYDGAVCLTESEGFPLGMCSQSCEQFCPDLDGYPTTFCTVDDVVASPLCHSRCDYGAYPGRGCRQGYVCSELARFNQPDAVVGTCVPGEVGEVSECLQWLIDRGVPFEPTTYAPRSPEGRPDLTCAIVDPIRLQSPVNGINLRYFADDPGNFRSLLMSCRLAQAITLMTEHLNTLDVTELVHLGTTVCRTTSFGTLSQHALGLAIDVGGFFDEDANWFGVEDHWEHDTDNPTTFEGQWLYAVAHWLYDNWIFDIILTPNYNDAHDNHFHLDLTPGYDAPFLGVHDDRYGPYIGVNPGAE